jgi:two-component system alkaline phosphatase synthesis response regulator PhoP
VQHILLIDATEDVRPLAGALEDAGFTVAHAPLDGAIGGARDDVPAVMLFNLVARPDIVAIRNLLRSPEMPQGTAAIAMVRTDQLSTLDFTVGFDDFLLYPSIPEEVAARVRRAIWLKSGVGSDNTLRAGDLMIDLANYKAFVSGRPVDLTYKEYELLRFLATNRDKVFTREALLNRVWGYDFYGGARTVDVHIRRLRSKIEDRAHTFIETVRNVGYRFHIE